LNKNIPSPLELKTMYSLYIVNGLIRYKPEAKEFFKMLLDEVKDRVANQIAAVGTERYRVLHDQEPMWHYLKFFRYLEKYGVVANASIYCFTVGTAFERGDNGSWVAAKTCAEQGLKMRTRQDALWALAASYINRPGVMSWYPKNKSEDQVRIAKDWRVDGAILSLNRGCTITAGTMEAKRMLQEAGFPTMLYEANMADPREFDEAGILRRVDLFMDSQGLHKLED
jgi:benzoyl-CoA reductase subunit B